MRITGGTLRGRSIKAPGGKVRPTQDKVREALFSILGRRIDGARFLDLFAGSGAVGLEAWSRGAEFVCWVESDHRVLSVLKQNVRQLCGGGPICGGTLPQRGKIRVTCGDAIRFLKKRLVEEQFDIIFADPPYTRSQPPSRRSGAMARREGGRSEVRSQKSRDSGLSEDQGWLDRLLEALGVGKMLAKGGLFIMEQRAGKPQEFTGQEGLVLVDERIYGETRLRMFQKK